MRTLQWKGKMSAYGRIQLANNLLPRLFPPPVFDCLQYANAEWRRPGRYHHMHVVTPGRQKVDTWGVVPDHNNSGFVLTCPGHCKEQTVLNYLVNALASSPRTDSTRKGFTPLRFFVGHHPICVYHRSTWDHYMWPNLPGLPLPYLHTGSL